MQDFYKKLLYKKLVLNFLLNSNRNTIDHCSHNNWEKFFQYWGLTFKVSYKNCVYTLFLMIRFVFVFLNCAKSLPNREAAEFP